MKTSSLIILLAGFTVGVMNVMGKTEPLDPSQDRPVRLYVQSYAEGDNGTSDATYNSDNCTWTFHWEMKNTNSWSLADGGKGSQSLTVLYDNDDCNGGFSHTIRSTQMTSSVSDTASTPGTMTGTQFVESLGFGYPYTFGTDPISQEWVPTIVWEHCAVNLDVGITAGWPGLWLGSYYPTDKENKGKYQRKADATILLETGGKGLPGLSVPQAVFQFYGSASEILDKYSATPTAGGTPTKVIAPTSITINNKALGSDGVMYQVLSDNITRDVTPRVKNKDYYTFYVDASRHTLVHQTICTASGNANNARTTIGIGEDVAVYLDPPVNMTFPETPFWYVLGEGSISPDTGSSTLLTANLSPGSATVKLNVRDVTLSVYFSIVVPDSIKVLSQVDWPPKEQDANGTLMGAETDFIVAICPTNVSFNKVLFRENPEPHSINVVWPNGTDMTINFNRTIEGYNLDCGQCMVGDKIMSFGDVSQLISSSYLFNGTSYVDFSFGNNWTYQYMNDSGTWVDFCSLNALFAYRGSDKQCHVEYLGNIGGWQGPY